MRRVMIFTSPWGWVGISETAKGIDAIALPKRSKRAIECGLRAMAGGLCETGESARLEA
ncbi:MAG: hypothetical protein HP491_17960, partial [Nitrospira sp.]|nr:hypothetical protein [Nitrospira sp.]